ncbi:conserved protein, unknown function [Plasmodium vivax]|nr:conserved protein, unknown function [Plasmodium vivax]
MAQADANHLHHYNRRTITEDNSGVPHQWSNRKTSSRTSLKDMHKGYSFPLKFKKNDETGGEASVVEVQLDVKGATNEFGAPFSAEANKTQRGRRSTHLVEQTSELFCDDQVGASRSERRSSQGGDAKKGVAMKLADSHILSKLTRTLLQGIQAKVEEEGKEAGSELKSKRKGEEKPICRGRSSSAMRERNLWSAGDELGGESPTGGLPNGAKWTTLGSGSQGGVFRRKGRASHVGDGPTEGSALKGETLASAPQVGQQTAQQTAQQIAQQVVPQAVPQAVSQIAQQAERTFYVYQTEGQIPPSCESSELVGIAQQEGKGPAVGSKSVCFVDEGRHSGGGYANSVQAEGVYLRDSFQGGMGPYLLQESLITDGSGSVVGGGSVIGSGSMVGSSSVLGGGILVGSGADGVAYHFVDAGDVRGGGSASWVGSVDLGGYGGQQGVASQAVQANWSGHPQHGHQPHYANYEMTQTPAAASIRISSGGHPKGVPPPQKQSYRVPPPATFAKKSFFCNSSVRNKQLQGGKQWRGNKTEILIYPNGGRGHLVRSGHLERSGHLARNGGLPNEPRRNSPGRRESPLLLSSPNKATIRPPSSNVFIRTKSLQRRSGSGRKSKGSVSPLSGFSLGRQKSLPVRTPSRNASSSTPICTQEITYSCPSQGDCIAGVVGDQRVIKAFASTLPHGSHHSGLVIRQQSNSGGSCKREADEDVRSYINKCSTEVSSKVTDVGSPLGGQMDALNGKIGRLTSRIRSITAEKWNLSELARLYKNECNRLREVIAKNKQAHYDPVHLRKVNYEQANAQLEEENEKLRSQMKTLGKAILSSYDINGIKKILARQIVTLNEENEKYRQEIKQLKDQKDVNREVLFNLSRGDVSTDAIDSVFMQTKNIVVEGHQTINVFYLNLKNLIDELFQRIKFLLLEDDYTPNEKLLYVTSLEELVNENFEEINHIVVKINELRKRMKDVKAHIFGPDRSNPNCSCKPSRIILEDDINHLEEELHSHSIMLKNLRKKNLALCLSNLHGQFTHEAKGDAPPGGAIKDRHKSDKHRSSNKEKGLHRREEGKATQAVRERPPPSLDKREGRLEERLEENPGESYHNRLHEKIRVIEHQLHTLNDHINSSFCDGEKEPRREDATPLDGEFCRNRKGDAQPGCAEIGGLTKECTKGKKKITNEGGKKRTGERHAKGESSYTSSPRSSASDESASAPSENKNWLSEEEVERSKSRMIELLVLLKGKHNADLVENTKSYVSSFGEYKKNNKYNLQKIYSNLKAIRDTIKNTEDDTERNILALIESQANEIKIFGNCVDDLKTTMAS